ncbi:MAG TPA: hypothetical protein PLW65_25300, partial [Pseudomonadota bacterium]|nr:hypothetical protein [Pseudomonadota bacterium]
ANFPRDMQWGQALQLVDDEELLEFGDDDALAGGGAVPRDRGRSSLSDREPRRQKELDDTEAPELFLNLSVPASRRLLN